MKNAFKNKLYSIGNSLKKYILGYSYHIENSKIKLKDKNNFVLAVSFCFSLAFLIIFRNGTFFNDLGGFFSYPFVNISKVSGIIILIVLLASIALAIAGTIIVNKRKIIILTDALGFVGFVLQVMFFIYMIGAYPVVKTNWLIWLIMVIPQFFLLFALFIRTFRFFFKLFGTDNIVTEGRKEYYEFLTNNEKRTGYRFRMYMKSNWGQVLITLALITLCIMVLYPLGITILRSFRVWTEDALDPFGIPKEFIFENYTLMWEMLSSTFLNSIITAVSVTAGATILSTMIAYAFIRFNFPLKNVLFYLIIGLMMIPGILSLVARYSLVNNLHLVGSLWGIILPGMIGYVPGSFLLIFTFFRGLPKDLFEAADVDGSNNFGIYCKIVLPLSKPILSTIIITTFVGEWNDYLWAYLITNGNEAKYTLPVYLNYLSDYFVTNLQTSTLMAGYVISAIPLVLIFAVASKQFIEGLTSGAFKM